MSKKVNKNTENTIDPNDIYTDVFANSAITISNIYGNKLKAASILKTLANDIKKLNGCNLSEIEYALLMQAKTLDHFFHETLRRLTDLKMINQIQVFADIALRAQNLSRKTYLAFADIKNPKRTTFIRQQNNALNQQVNNSSELKFSKIDNPANELLEENNEQRLEHHAETTTIQTNSSMETVENSRRKN